jgi:hypothetical protein
MHTTPQLWHHTCSQNCMGHTGSCGPRCSTCHASSTTVAASLHTVAPEPPHAPLVHPHIGHVCPHLCLTFTTLVHPGALTKWSTLSWCSTGWAASRSGCCYSVSCRWAGHAHQTRSVVCPACHSPSWRAYQAYPALRHPSSGCAWVVPALHWHCGLWRAPVRVFTSVHHRRCAFHAMSNDSQAPKGRCSPPQLQ